MDDLSAEDRTLLERVRAEKKSVPDPASPGALAALAARGLLQAVSKGRGKAKQEAFELTKEGKAAVAPPRPARAAARAAKPAPLTRDELRAELAAMEERILRAVSAAAAGQTASLPPAVHAAQPVQPQPALPAAIADGIREANLAGRHGGLVPIPEVRRVVLARTGATREQFDAALLALERGFNVDLKIANDPRRPDAAEGISVPGRGLVYFALAK